MFLIAAMFRALARVLHPSSSQVSHSASLVSSCRLSGAELHYMENCEGLCAKFKVRWPLVQMVLGKMERLYKLHLAWMARALSEEEVK